MDHRVTHLDSWVILDCCNATLSDYDELVHLVEDRYAKALRHVQNCRVESQINFHRTSLQTMLACGMTRFRFIVHVPTDGLIPICTSRGEDEHWWFVGSLTCCNFNVPCSPDVLRAGLVHVPATFDPYLASESLAACSQFSLVETCEFPPTDLASFVAAAPKKQRSEWGRLLRKAAAAGITGHVVSPAEAIASARKLIPAYKEYWHSLSPVSYMDEAAWCESILDVFASCSSWVGVELRKDGEPLAVNFAWLARSEHGLTVYDTICVRNPAEEYRPYSLGILAVLYNIDACFTQGARWYSMAPGAPGYKAQFAYSEHSKRQAKALSVLSDIDLIFANVPGYYKGVWYSEADELPALEQSRIDELHSTYQFLSD